MKVFSKEKYLKQRHPIFRDMHCPTWADECDGKPVYDGSCSPGDGYKYLIHDGWCIDVPDPKVSDILDIVKEENTMYTMKDFITQPIAVRVGQKYKEEFLKMCEAEGLKWKDGTTAATFTPFRYGDNLTIGYNVPGEPKGLGYAEARAYREHDIKVVDFKDFAAPRYQIIIDCDGKTTTAKMMVDGKVVKTGVAKYNPTDKFDFSIGAKTAFDRLWVKSEPTKPEPVKSFKVGDRVKCTKSVDGRDDIVGKYGTVIHVMPNSGFPITVEFDDNIGAHDGLGRVSGKPKHCRWCPVDALELVTVREVKRHAKAGEWVKIVKAKGHPAERYKNGDILKVTREWVNGGGRVHLTCGGTHACDTEYVVLEGYNP